MTTLEQSHLKGFTLKNLIVTIVGTTSIVTSVMTTYFALKDDVKDLKNSTEVINRVNDMRLKILETQVQILQQDVKELKERKQ